MYTIRSFLIAVLALLMLAAPWQAFTETEKAPMRGVGKFSIPSWFKASFLDLREDIAEAGQNGKHVMIFFHQDGCPYCAELINNNFSQREIVEYTRENFDVIEINMWGDREVTGLSGKTTTEKKFAADLKVWFTPTLLFFNDDADVALRVNGYFPPHKFLTALKYVAEGHSKKTPFHKHLAQVSPPAPSGKLHDEPFFLEPPYDLLSLGSGRPLAVFFEQKDCPDCDRLHEKVLPRPRTREQIERFNVVRLDRWSSTPVVTPAGKKTTARKWADELGIAYVPSAVLFDKGKEVIRIEAFLKSFHVQSVLDYCASGAYKEQPSLQRFIQTRAERLREQGVTVDLWH